MFLCNSHNMILYCIKYIHRTAHVEIKLWRSIKKLVQYQTTRKGFDFIFMRQTWTQYFYTLNVLCVISDRSQVRMNRESKLVEFRAHIYYTSSLNTTHETLVHVIVGHIHIREFRCRVGRICIYSQHGFPSMITYGTAETVGFVFLGTTICLP